LQVRQADNLPLRVCKPCVEKINGFHDFYAQCKIADTEFHNEVHFSDANIFVTVKNKLTLCLKMLFFTDKPLQKSQGFTGSRKSSP